MSHLHSSGTLHIRLRCCVSFVHVWSLEDPRLELMATRSLDGRIGTAAVPLSKPTFLSLYISSQLTRINALAGARGKLRSNFF
jgi:hypothetical protein